MKFLDPAVESNHTFNECVPALNDRLNDTVDHVLQFAVAGNASFATHTDPSSSTFRDATPLPAL